ncbi:DVUA0089 family protein [Chamaesiphon sp. OTE_8_metabat_110]|uniref:DVUA0089 family protein n=1 Tax=Chamaesiphon sp. OTE_8_metabat_110 TaxID=2964696 RepID=UPI00286CDF5C|nr:DVUA0089 family protein [Chamaesiphon sp. OTE_8_metabat_110]
MKKFTLATLLGITTATIGVTLVAPAHGASFTGSLVNADAIDLLPFTSTGAELRFRSLSYNGGTNDVGTLIPPGGFSPVLTIFNPSGNYFNEYTATEDLNFTATLSPGNYQAAVSTFGRFFDFPTKTNISQGFDGSGEFFGRNPNYAVDIVAVSSATAVPEPVSFIGTAVAGFAVVKLKRKLSAGKKST